MGLNRIFKRIVTKGAHVLSSHLLLEMHKVEAITARALSTPSSISRSKAFMASDHTVFIFLFDWIVQAPN